VISAVNADLGEAVEEVACEYDGPEFRLGINPDYLSQFLSAVDTDRIRLELKDENTQCVGYPQDPPVAPEASRRRCGRRGRGGHGSWRGGRRRHRRRPPRARPPAVAICA